MAWQGMFRRSVALIALGLAVGACVDSAPGPVEPARPSASLTGDALQVVERTVATVEEVVEATIGVEGGTLQIPGGHSLHFPAGALAESTTIRAVRSGSEVRIEFGPHGLLFPESALPTLTLSYVDGTGLTDADAAGLAIAYLASDGTIQEVLQTSADTSADVVQARLRHFSTYALVTD